LDWSLFGLSLLLIAPPLVTHVLPGVAMYAWVVATTVLLLCVPLCALRVVYMHKAAKWESSPDEQYTERQQLNHKRTLKTFLTCMFMLLSFICMVVLTAAFQSTFNWSFVTYHHERYEVDYITTLKFEADGRTLSCYWEVAVESAFNSMQLFSSFIG
jgi:multisubunit Na+/H+ antiporter MnhB subunit